MYGVISKLLQEYKYCQMISNKNHFWHFYMKYLAAQKFQTATKK